MYIKQILFLGIPYVSFCLCIMVSIQFRMSWIALISISVPAPIVAHPLLYEWLNNQTVKKHVVLSWRLASCLLQIAPLTSSFRITLSSPVNAKVHNIRQTFVVRHSRNLPVLLQKISMIWQMNAPQPCSVISTFTGSIHLVFSLVSVGKVRRDLHALHYLHRNQLMPVAVS